MTIQNANAIVQRVGPCRIAIDEAAFPDLVDELRLAGCHIASLSDLAVLSSGHGTSAAFLSWTGTNQNGIPENTLKTLNCVDILILHSAGQARRPVERSLFDAGWQRHPGGMMLAEYPAWSANALPPLTFWRRGRPAGSTLLLQGVEADPRIARYAMAANFVRPGDRILIDAPEAEDGAAILMALSRGGSIVPLSSASLADRRPTGHGGEKATPSLSHVGDHSIDLVVGLEPAVPESWRARLDDYARILKHDGRIILGWQRGPAGSARPQDWAMFAEAVAERFLPETRYVHLAIGPDACGPQALFPVALDQSVTTDWLMVVASANPLLGSADTATYDHPAYSTAKGPVPALVDFGSAYDNPWLYRSMVQMGERLGDDVMLARMAECVIEDAGEQSADRGAAIAVLGYRVLEMRRADLALSVLPLISSYVAHPLTDDMPLHVRRWRISLAFLAGRLSELTGDHGAAKRWYRQSAEADWSGFSPLLATKSIAASFYEARLHLADGDSQTALACFRHGTDTALRAAEFPHERQMDAHGQPLPFYLQELAEVIDMGSQCANALAHFPLWQRDPGLFWRQVDIRRFGLASWARDLERENERLRAA